MRNIFLTLLILLLPSTGMAMHFPITFHNEAHFAKFPKKTTVFSVDIYAAAGVEDVKIQHAANIMAQYLDNNGDGKADNPKVLRAMQKNRAFLIMWKSEDDLEEMEPPEDRVGQDLGADETRPQWHPKRKGRFDASIEEVWHLISHAGYGYAYPEAFSEESGSMLCQAMDKARGGHFTKIPNKYPKTAWYSYEDPTCDYPCMATEYFYWGLTSLLGAQENRGKEIDEEWRLPTPKSMKKDQALHKLLKTDKYHLPTALPDGNYQIK